MRCKILLALFVCVALLNPLASWAQSSSVISGKVTDEAGEPLPGANVSIQLTNLGAATDVNGEFHFTVPASALRGQEVSLQARFIGYRTKTEKITLTSEGATVDFALHIDVLDMDAIVVTGVVEATPRTKMAFSVGRVNAAALEKVTVSSMETALRGKVAGVKVVQGSGRPGTDASILLRGATSINSDGRSQDPLYIIDGVIIDPSISGSPLSDINADDIESIEVIKGAAGASLYGSRAANGVVNITTNRGKNLAVNQTRIRIRNEFGFNQLRKDYPTRKHHFNRIYEGTADYIGSDGVKVTPGDFINEVGDFVDPRGDRKIGDRYTGNYDPDNPDPQDVSNIFFMDNDYKWITTGDIFVNDDETPLIDPATNQPAGLRLLPNGKTINQVQQFFDPGTFLTNSVSLARNMENTNFSISFSNRVEDGVIGGLNGYDRKTVRMGIDHQFKRKLSISASAFYSTSSQDNITEGVGSPFFGLVFHAGDIDLSARHAAAGVKTDVYPDGIPIDIGGQLFSAPVRSTTPRQNPLYETFNNDRTDDRTRFMGGASLSYRPVNWAKLEGSVSYDRSNRELFRFWDIGYDNEFNSELLKGLIQKQPEFDEAVNGNLTASFQKAFFNNDFTLRAKARALFERSERQDTFAEGADLAVRNTPDLNVASSLKLDINSRLQEVRSNGYSFITGMDFKDRYIADVLVRRDGSSLFGPDERWHNYFRASAAWRLSQESWWFTDKIQEFKFRGSFGTAGGRPNFFARFETWNVVDGNVTKNTLGNKNLKPEFSKELELGMDITFLEKFSLEITRAETVIEDQLLLVPFAGFAGYTDQWQNAGTLETNTWEFSLNGVLLTTRDMSVTVGINIDRTRATVTKLDVPAYNWSPRDTQNVNVFRVEAGLPLGTLYGSKNIRKIDDLLLQGVTQDQLSQFQINDEGYVVWVGGDGSDTNLWMKGISDQLWGTRSELTLTDGPFGARSREFDWGEKVVLRELVGDNENTQFKIGDTTPDFNWAVFSNLTWKGFNLYTLFDAQVGGDIYSQTVAWGYGVEFAQEEADQSGKSDALKKPTSYFSGTARDKFVFDGSYVKLRELSLRYTFKHNQLQGIFGGALHKISVGVIGRNLLTWDNFDQGYDPEVGVSRRGGGGTDSSAAIAKIDSFSYPNFRTYSGFLEFQF